MDPDSSFPFETSRRIAAETALKLRSLAMDSFSYLAGPVDNWTQPQEYNLVPKSLQAFGYRSLISVLYDFLN